MSQNNKNIFERIDDWVYNLESSFVSNVTSNKYSQLDKWRDGKPEKAKENKPADQEGIDAENQESIELESSENINLESQEPQETTEKFVFELLTPREISKRAQQNFRIFSGFKWYMILICVAFAAVYPWLPARNHKSGDLSMFDSIGECIANGDIMVMLIASIFITIITCMSCICNKEGHLVGFRSSISTLIQKGDTPYTKQADRKAEYITESYRDAFNVILINCFLGVLLHAFTQLMLLYGMSNAFNLSIRWTGIISFSFLCLNLLLLMYYQGAVARVVYEDWRLQITKTDTKSPETPTDSYQK